MEHVLRIAVFVFAYKIVLKFSSATCGWVLSLVCSHIPKITSLKSIIANKKLALNSISAKDEFARYAKAQREINKYSTQLESTVKEYNTLKTTTIFVVGILVRLCFILMLTIMMWSYRGLSIGKLPTSKFWPLDRILCFPTGNPGSLSAPVWLFICVQASHAIL